MRGLADAQRIQVLMEELGRRASGPGRVYLVGGSSAVLVGWRQSTKDVDLELDPEPAGVFEAIRDLKEELDLNVELASPAHFVPALPEWPARSEPIARHGAVEFFHYDFYGQAFAKLVRGHDQDLVDVGELVARRKVEPGHLLELVEQIQDRLLRYPRLDARDVVRRVRDWVQGQRR